MLTLQGRPQRWLPARESTPEQVGYFIGWLGDQALRVLLDEHHEKLRDLPDDHQLRRQIVHHLLQTDRRFADEFAATVKDLAEATRDTAEAGIIRLAIQIWE